MPRKAEKQGNVHALHVARRGVAPAELAPLLTQLMLPMVAGMAATKRTFQNLVTEFGLASMQALFGAHAEALAGPKHKHQKSRTMNHWGSAPAEFSFAGRKVSVPRPRVRSRNGGEVPIPFVEELRSSDPLSKRVIEQILLGVSTRGYAQSLDPHPQTYYLCKRLIRLSGGVILGASRQPYVEGDDQHAQRKACLGSKMA